MQYPASILYKSIAGRYLLVSYPNGPITDRYRFIKNAHWVGMGRTIGFDSGPGKSCGAKPDKQKGVSHLKIQINFLFCLLCNSLSRFGLFRALLPGKCKTTKGLEKVEMCGKKRKGNLYNSIFQIDNIFLNKSNV